MITLIATACSSTTETATPSPGGSTPGPTPRVTLPPPSPTPGTPSPEPTPTYPTATDELLGSVYAAIRPANLRSVTGPLIATRGSELRLAYEVMNASPEVVVVPTTAWFDHAGHWYGTLQTWIERLGSNSSLDACLPNSAHEGSRYAIEARPGGFADPTGSIPPGDGMTLTALLPAQVTDCLPLGRYRFHLEYRKLLATESVVAHLAVTLEVRNPTEWIISFPGLPSGLATVQIPAGSTRGTSTIRLAGLDPATDVTIEIRTGGCDRMGPRVVPAVTVRPKADGSYETRTAITLTAKARTALARGETLGFRMTAGTLQSCTRYSGKPFAGPANRSPTSWSDAALRVPLGDGMSVAASSFSLHQPPTLAIDGLTTDLWNSGGYAPAWLELDLGRNQAVRGLRLMPSQLPNTAETVTRIWGRADGRTTEKLLYEIAGTTQDGQWIDVALAAPVSVRYVRIETISSPSWIAWREISVTGPSVPRPNVLPVGYHQGTTLTVAGRTQCNANGWAVDPDHPAADVTVRVLVDGHVAWTGSADQSRPDVEAAGFADGTSGYSVVLSSRLARGVSHEIRVQAQDIDTGQWVDLQLTFRTLTCT